MNFDTGEYMGGEYPAGTTAHSVSSIGGLVATVSIVVLVAAFVSTFVMGFESGIDDSTPSAEFDYEYVPTGEDNANDRPYVVITHESGPALDGTDLYIHDDSGNAVTWSETRTTGPATADGESVAIDGFDGDGALDPICEEGQTYKVIYEDDNGRTSVAGKWTASTDPDLPAGSSSDDDGDGIPDWC